MNKRDFITIKFDGKIATTGELFDTTSESVAKEENLYEPTKKYGPTLVIVGEGMVLPGVEKHLEEMKPGEEKEFTIKPEEAFGRRNHLLIQIVSLSKFTKENINPVPGLYITIDNRKAKIQSVSGGRVRVDFNHPLAGKELSYKLKIIKHITDVKEKTVSVFEYFAIKGETLLTEGNVSIKTEKPVPEAAQKLVSETMKKWIPEIKDIKFSSAEKKQETVSNNK